MRDDKAELIVGNRVRWIDADASRITASLIVLDIDSVWPSIPGVANKRKQLFHSAVLLETGGYRRISIRQERGLVADDPKPQRLCPRRLRWNQTVACVIEREFISARFIGSPQSFGAGEFAVFLYLARITARLRGTGANCRQTDHEPEMYGCYAHWLNERKSDIAAITASANSGWRKSAVIERLAGGNAHVPNNQIRQSLEPPMDMRHWDSARKSIATLADLFVGINQDKFDVGHFRLFRLN
jgi:hypothetical protein